MTKCYNSRESDISSHEITHLSLAPRKSLINKQFNTHRISFLPNIGTVFAANFRLENVDEVDTFLKYLVDHWQNK